MKRLFPTIFSVLLVLLSQCEASGFLLPDNSEIDYCFSPGPVSCSAKIIQALSNAQTSIVVQAYSFTSKELAEALIEANRRGVEVSVVLDKSQKNERYSVLATLVAADIPVFIDSRHAIAHNKVMVIDKEVVVTGSYNFTKAAEERNAENLLIIYSGDLARAYLENIQRHREHSTRAGSE